LVGYGHRTGILSARVPHVTERARVHPSVYNIASLVQYPNMQLHPSDHKFFGIIFEIQIFDRYFDQFIFAESF